MSVGYVAAQTSRAWQFSGADGWVVLLLVLTALLWVLVLTAFLNYGGSDAAGNALMSGLNACFVLLLWVLLSCSLAVAGVASGEMPGAAIVAAIILLPGSAVAALPAGHLLERRRVSPFTWPILVPGLVAPLVAFFSLWTLFPAIHAAIPTTWAGGLVWGAVLFLSIGELFLRRLRHVANRNEALRQEKLDQEYALLTTESPLWDWTPFLDTPNNTKRDEVLELIRAHPHRQDEAERMLDRGDFPLLYLGAIDLTPTPTLFEKARRLLRLRTEALTPKVPKAQPYTAVAQEVDAAVTALEWLVGYGCPCDEEIAAFETVANAYRDPGWDTVRLTRLREPQALGATLREDPARFEMLTAQSHLKAWLKFAGRDEFREEALAGARSSPRRTAEAVEMLDDTAGSHAGWPVMKYLPYLNLEPTPPVCQAVLKTVRGIYTDLYLYLPTSDDEPRPYTWVSSRVEDGLLLPTLRWLVEQGCDCEEDVGKVEAIVRAYQESPERAEVLATLASLHRKA